MRYDKWKLYREVLTQNELLEYESSWEYITDIECNVSTSLYTQITDERVYRVYNSTALTTYTNFESNEKYKISNGNGNEKHEYALESFNTHGRTTQLTLKEVIKNG